MQHASPLTDTFELIVRADQLRAARAMLGWSLTEASRRAAVSVTRVVASERAGLVPTSGEPDSGLIDAYRAAGIRFFGHADGGRGLSLAPGSPSTP